MPDSISPNPTAVQGARLARRLISNYVFQTMNWGVRLAEQLLLIPLYITAWGTVFYKDWIVLYAIVAFLGWCTLGTDEYFGNLFLRSVSVGDRAALRRQMRVGLFVAMSVTVLIFVLLYGALLTTDLPHLLGFSAMDEQTTLFCLIAMTLPMWTWYAASVLRAVYRAYGDFSRGECIFAIYNVSQIACVALLLALKQSPRIVCLPYAVLPLLYALAITIDIRRRYPEVALGFALPDRAEWRRLIPQSLFYFTNPLAVALTQNATLLLFGFVGIGAVATVQFNVLRIFTGLTRQIGSQSFAVGSGIEMARQHAQEDYAGCRRLYADTGRVVSCLVGILAGISIPVSRPFVTLWTHGAVTSDLPLVLCFLVGIVLAAPGRASLMLLRYTNQARAIAWASCLYSIGGLALALPLAWRFDGFGVALAFAVTEIIGIGLYPPIMVSFLLGFGMMRHLTRGYVAAALAFAPSFAVGSLIFDGSALGATALAARLALWAAIVLPLGGLMILSQNQRGALLARLRRSLAPFVGLRMS